MYRTQTIHNETTDTYKLLVTFETEGRSPQKIYESGELASKAKVRDELLKFTLGKVGPKPRVDPAGRREPFMPLRLFTSGG